MRKSLEFKTSQVNFRLTKKGKIDISDQIKIEAFMVKGTTKLKKC